MVSQSESIDRKVFDWIRENKSLWKSLVKKRAEMVGNTFRHEDLLRNILESVRKEQEGEN